MQALEIRAVSDCFAALFGERRGSGQAPRDALSALSPMSEDAFWALVAKHAQLENRERARALRSELVALGPERVHEWNEHEARYSELLRHEDIYDAGCRRLGQLGSDDGFSDFRAWAISCGREFVYALLKDPDAALRQSPLPAGADPDEMEALSYVGMKAELQLAGELDDNEDY